MSSSTDNAVKDPTPDAFARSLPDEWRARFLVAVNFDGPLSASLGPCWSWTRCTPSVVYGMFSIKRRMKRAHRLSYEVTFGPIADGFDVHHICENTGCVRPSHLLALPHGDHTRLGDNASTRNASKAACPRGHEFVNRGGRRVCRSCEKDAEDRYRSANPDRVRLSRQRAGRRYRSANHEACLAREAAYRSTNREAINARRAAERAADPSKLRAASARWRSKNLERAREADRERKRAAYWRKRQLDEVVS